MRRRPRTVALCVIASASLGLGLAFGAIGAAGKTKQPSAPTPSINRIAVYDVLRARGIGSASFGASPATVRRVIGSIVGQRGGGYMPGGTCGLDHEITWWDKWTSAGTPSLTVYFRDSGFVGYQYGDIGRLDMGLPPRRPRGGWRLATTRGLVVSDTTARGRRLYGRAFTLSAAQGGTWKLRLASGVIRGYAWDPPKDGPLSWHGVIATIDAGDVGCPALSP